MVSVCAGLVTVEEQSHIIRLVHFTAQDYFRQTWTIWFPQENHEIWSTCVTYVSFESFRSGACPKDEDFEVRVDDYTLFSYVAEHWGHHIRPQFLDRDILASLLDDTPKLEACVQGLYAWKGFPDHRGNSQAGPRQMTGLHLAACFGLKETVE